MFVGMAKTSRSNSTSSSSEVNDNENAIMNTNEDQELLPTIELQDDIEHHNTSDVLFEDNQSDEVDTPLLADDSAREAADDENSTSAESRIDPEDKLDYHVDDSGSCSFLMF